MADKKDPGEGRRKIFPGQAEQKPVTEPDKTEGSTNPSTPKKDKGTEYKSTQKGYKGSHRRS